MLVQTSFIKSPLNYIGGKQKIFSNVIAHKGQSGFNSLIKARKPLKVKISFYTQLKSLSLRIIFVPTTILNNLIFIIYKNASRIPQQPKRNFRALKR